MTAREDGSDYQDDNTPYRCPETWERPKSAMCNPHRCDRDEGHDGKHKCDCGRTHR